MTDADAAADAFEVLSDPSRVAILRELAGQFYRHDGRPVGFADLRRAVGIDDPGRFNYHLDRLRDQFVVKRDDGYAPTVAGLKAIESAEAGVYTDDTEPASAAVDYDCPDCGGRATATYENHYVTVTCDDHGRLFRTTVPATLYAGDDLDAVVQYAIAEMWRRVDRATDGVCPVCRAPAITVEFRAHDDAVLADTTCAACYYEETNHVALFALSHPAVQSLASDHGHDLKRRLPREFLDDWTDDAAFADADRSAVELTVSIGDEDVTLRVRDDLSVEAV
ncbi:MAG: winged helix-turn-helix domain-containing protein [Halobacterium sp.]